MCQNKQDFVHLHAHTDISVQDALPKPKAYAMKAREMGFPAAAITDHGKMGGCIEFVDACRTPHETFAPIKPIIGMEAYTVANRHVKEMTTRPDGSKTRDHRHLTLLAMNETGYKNLLNIASIGAEEGFYYDPRVDWETISAHNEGIIALSGCLGSETSRALLRGDDAEAENVMRRFKDTFGDRYYAELQYHGIPEQKIILPKLASLAAKLDIPCIASNDVHYLDAMDWQVHDILIQMRSINESGTGKKNGKKEAYGSHQFYLKSDAEMSKIFSSKPDAVRNTVGLAERVEDFLKLDVPHLLPEVKIPTEDARFRDFWQRHLPHHKPKEAYLSYLAYSGLKELGLEKNQGYNARLRHELNSIIYMEVVDYFLIQSEMVGFMKNSDILYGIRGSGVGSLVLHCLQVCPVDPMKWNLLFERFLNPGRGTQYKIDLSCYPAKQWLADNPALDQADSVKRLKSLVKEQVEKFPEHGPDMAKELWVLENQGLAGYLCSLADNGYRTSSNECQLWTAYFLGLTDQSPEDGMLVSKVATLPDVDTDIDDRRRSDVIDWARGRFGKDHVAMIGTKGTYQAKAAVLGSLKVSEDFQKRWGDKSHIMAQVVSKSIPTRQQPPMTIEDAIEESEEFASYARQYPGEIAIAKRLVGTISHLGIHAGGVLVSSKPIRDVAPLENNKGVLVSAYDMSAVERVGLVKYDYLGLATYQMLSRALGFIENRHGVKIDLTQIVLDDPNVLRLYAQGKTDSIFQFASAGMKKWLKELQPDSVEELIAMNALFRPGPLDYIPKYIDGKRNPHKVKYSHPVLEKILSVTYGIPVYQEQLMSLFREMAGFSWQEVDKVRKAVSKKQGAEFDKACKSLAERALARGFEQPVIDEVLELIKAFGGYAFNRCLSANTIITVANGEQMDISQAYMVQPQEVMSMWEDGVVRPHKVAHIVKSGIKPLYEIKTQGKRVIRATAEHRLLTTDGYKTVSEMNIGTELIVQPRKVIKKQRTNRNTTMSNQVQSDTQKEEALDRMRIRQSARNCEEKSIKFSAKRTSFWRLCCQYGAERVTWVHPKDPNCRQMAIERSMSTVRKAYGAGPGYSYCSVASNGIQCASAPERVMCEWLIESGVQFEMHKVLRSGRVSDFYFNGTYWEMDDMDHENAYFKEKYGDMPYVVLTPEDFRETVSRHLGINYVAKGDPISSITPCGDGETYDIEMAPDGPKNFIADGIVSHNSHACSYSLLSYSTAYLRYYYPAEWLAACMQNDRDDEDKMALYRRECRSEAITVIRASVNESGMETIVTKKGAIALPLTSIKGVGSMAQAVVDTQPFTDMMDFAVRARPNSGMVRSLVEAHALDCFSELSSVDGTDKIMEYYEDVVAARNADEKRRQREARQRYKVTSVLDDDDDQLSDGTTFRRPNKEPDSASISRTRPRATRPNSLRNVLGNNLSLNELCDL